MGGANTHYIHTIVSPLRKPYHAFSFIILFVVRWWLILTAKFNAHLICINVSATILSTLINFHLSNPFYNFLIGTIILFRGMERSVLGLRLYHCKPLSYNSCPRQCGSEVWASHASPTLWHPPFPTTSVMLKRDMQLLVHKRTHKYNPMSSRLPFPPHRIPTLASRRFP